MHTSATLPPNEAAQTLQSVRAARAVTRRRLSGYAFPLIVFGALTLLSAPFFAIWEGAGVALFWLVAAPLGTFAVARHQRTRALTMGAGRAGRPYAITATALIAACFALGIVGGASGELDIAKFGPPLAICAAYVVFAWLERSIALAALATVVGALTIGFAVADVDDAAQILALIYGASFVALGLGVRVRSPRP